MGIVFRCISTLLCCLPLFACDGPRHARKEPVVAYTPVFHDVHYPRDMALPSDKEEMEIEHFIGTTAANPGGHVTLAANDLADPVTLERVSDLRAMLIHWGVNRVVLAEDQAIPTDRVRIGSSVVALSAPAGCPNWNEPHMANFSNGTNANYGCAHAANLSRLIADPNDYVAGKSDNRPDAERSAAVVDAYRSPPAEADGAAPATAAPSPVAQRGS